MSFLNKGYASSLSDADIAAAEKVIGSMPADLIAFYRQQNGGIPDGTLFTTDAGDDYSLDYMFSIPESGLEPAGQNIVKVNKALKQESLIPDDHLVFGSDPGGNYFSVARADGAVWYHPMDVWEEDRSPEENQSETMERLSGSFPAFMDGLTED